MISPGKLCSKKVLFIFPDLILCPTHKYSFQITVLIEVSPVPTLVLLFFVTGFNANENNFNYNDTIQVIFVPIRGACMGITKIISKNI